MEDHKADARIVAPPEATTLSHILIMPLIKATFSRISAYLGCFSISIRRIVFIVPKSVVHYKCMLPTFRRRMRFQEIPYRVDRCLVIENFWFACKQFATFWDNKATVCGLEPSRKGLDGWPSSLFEPTCCHYSLD